MPRVRGRPASVRRSERWFSLATLRAALGRPGPESLVRPSWRRPEEPLEPRVRRLVADRLGVDPSDLTADVSLTDDLAADSLDLVELAAGMEEELGVCVPESMMDELRTYGELVAVAQARTRERRAQEAWVESQRTPPFILARIRPPASRSGALEHAGW